MEIQGIIKVIGTTAEISEKFKKRELVIQTEEQYPQFINIQFSNDKCGLLDTFKVGALVEVGINLRGREWVNPQGETKYFNTIEGWKIYLKNTQAPAPKQAPVQQHQAPVQNNQPFEYANPSYVQNNDSDSDLPF